MRHMQDYGYHEHAHHDHGQHRRQEEQDSKRDLLIHLLALELRQPCGDVGPLLAAGHEGGDRGANVFEGGTDLLCGVAVAEGEGIVLDGLELCHISKTFLDVHTLPRVGWPKYSRHRERTYVDGDTQRCTELVVPRVALSNGRARVVYPAGDADFLELVA